jgi:N-acetylneuraminic acid mutarotase
MPDYRYAGAAVTLDGFLYVIGGFGDNTASPLRYDPTTNTWARIAPLNQEREHTAAVAHDGKIYVLGGRWVTDMSSIEIYDPSTDMWTLGAPMKQPRAGHGAAVVGNQIFVGGGELVLSGSLESTVKTVEVYNLATNTWGSIFDLPNGIHGVPAAGVDGIFYLLGGSESAGEVANRGTVWAYRP